MALLATECPGADLRGSTRLAAEMSAGFSRSDGLAGRYRFYRSGKTFVSGTALAAIGIPISCYA
jgi:hypothetical protein